MPKQKTTAVSSVDNAELEALRRKVAELELKLEEASKREMPVTQEPVKVQAATQMPSEELERYKENVRKEAQRDAETKYTKQMAALHREIGVLEGKISKINPINVKLMPTPVNVQTVAPVNVVVKKKEAKESEAATSAPTTNNYRPFIMPQQPMMAPVMMMPPPQAPAPAPAPVPEVKEEPTPEPVVERVARNWEIRCPNCGKLLKVNDKSSYHRCPACTKVFQSETKGRQVAELLGVDSSAKRPEGMKDGLPTTLPPKKN